MERRPGCGFLLPERPGEADRFVIGWDVAATGWTPEKAAPDAKEEYLGFPALSAAWADTLYHRLVAAHARGDVVVALDAGRRLERFRQTADARAKAVGVALKSADPQSYRTPAYIANANVAAKLLVDQERRAKEPSRGPIPPRGAPPERIATMIRDLTRFMSRCRW